MIIVVLLNIIIIMMHIGVHINDISVGPGLEFSLKWGGPAGPALILD